ncbi:unnamed protein product [Caretta caretta]
MHPGNRTTVSKFILLGFESIRSIELLLFTVFLFMYTLTLAGNLTIIALVLNSHLIRLPMYFFLSNFSFLELMITSATVPMMLVNIVLGTRTISFISHLMQSFFCFLLGFTKVLILAVMSFACNLAICNLLRYAGIMNSQTCLNLLVASWAGGFLIILVHSLVMDRLPFSGPNDINHITFHS